MGRLMRRAGLMGVVVITAGAAFYAPAVAQDKQGQRDAYCAELETPAERVICSDRSLTRLDAELNDIYRHVRDALSRREVKALRGEQLGWLRQRNACGGNASCIGDAYTDRIAVLTGEVERVKSPGKSHVEIGCVSGRVNADGSCFIETKLHPTCDVFGKRGSPLSREAVGVTFTNRTDALRGVMWLNAQGTPVDYSQLDPGQSYSVTTYTGHLWMFTDGPGNCMEVFTARRGVTTFRISAESPAFGPEED